MYNEQKFVPIIKQRPIHVNVLVFIFVYSFITDYTWL